MMKYGIYFLSLVFFAFTSMACGGGEADRQMEELQKPEPPPSNPSEPSNPSGEPESPSPESPEPESPPAVSSLSLRQHTLEMHSGDRFDMQTTGTAVGTLKWSSSSTAVFIVSSTGEIEAIGIGTATLTVTDSQKSDQCSITVKAKLDGVNQQDELLDAKDKESLDIKKQN